MKTKRLAHQAALLAAVLAAGNGLVQAAAITWNNTAGGSWGTAANWTGTTSGTGANAGLPGNGDDVTLGLNTTTYTVTYNTDLYSGTTPNHRVNSVTVTNTGAGKTVTLEISAANFKTAGNLTAQTSATVSVLSGGVVSTGGSVMTQQGGTMTLAAGGSIAMTATTTANVLVGNDSNGNFTMTGGTLSSSGLESSNRGIFIGSSANGNAAGTMTVSGGSVTNAGLLNIGRYSGASNSNRTVSSSLTMSGGSTTWSNTGNIILGQNVNTGTGTTSVITGTLALQNGTFTPGASSIAFVGAARGVGNLNISGGSFGTSSNPLTEIRIGTLYTTDSVALAKGTGTLTLSGGEVFTKKLATDSTTTSFISFTGGKLHTGGTVVNNGSVFTVGNGTNSAELDLISGGTGTHSFANGLAISSNATLSGVGSITGDMTLNSGSTLQLTIGSPLAITGSLTLVGSDNIKFVGTADNISNYVVATYTSLQGSGSFVTDASLPAGYSLSTATPGATHAGDP